MLTLFESLTACVERLPARERQKGGLALWIQIKEGDLKAFTSEELAGVENISDLLEVLKKQILQLESVDLLDLDFYKSAANFRDGGEPWNHMSMVLPNDKHSDGTPIPYLVVQKRRPCSSSRRGSEVRVKEVTSGSNVDETSCSAVHYDTPPGTSSDHFLTVRSALPVLKNWRIKKWDPQVVQTHTADCQVTIICKGLDACPVVHILFVLQVDQEDHKSVPFRVKVQANVVRERNCHRVSCLCPQSVVSQEGLQSVWLTMDTRDSEVSTENHAVLSVQDPDTSLETIDEGGESEDGDQRRPSNASEQSLRDLP